MNGSLILRVLRAATATEERPGVHVRRAFCPSERYVIDFDADLRKDWRQYDTEQDASYFGVWVNLSTREVLTFAEGDWSLTTCQDDPTMAGELQRMADFYGSPPPAFVSIDTETGQRTEYYDERPSLGGGS